MNQVLRAYAVVDYYNMKAIMEVRCMETSQYFYINTKYLSKFHKKYSVIWL